MRNRYYIYRYIYIYRERDRERKVRGEDRKWAIHRCTKGKKYWNQASVHQTFPIHTWHPAAKILPSRFTARELTPLRFPVEGKKRAKSMVKQGGREREYDSASTKRNWLKKYEILVHRPTNPSSCVLCKYAGIFCRLSPHPICGSCWKRWVHATTKMWHQRRLFKIL